MGTLASQAEIGVWVQALGALLLASAAGIREYHHDWKITKPYVQNPVM